MPSKGSRRTPGATKVVIVGGGFAGLEAARRLAGAAVDVTVIDQAPGFVFRPLLSRFLAGEVSRSSVFHPYADVAAAIPGVAFQAGSLEEVDPRARRVLVSGRSIGYDYLLLGTGARSAMGGELSASTKDPLTLDGLEDCARLERAMQEAVAVATTTGRQPTFVVIGGGPHGVEVAPALLSRLRAILDQAPRPSRADARVVLVERSERLLAGYPEPASRHAARVLGELGVEVLLGRAVTGSAAGDVLGQGPLGGEARLVWAGGRRGPALAEIPGLGSAILEADLSVRGHPEILALGDLAACNASPSFPALAASAMQTGHHAARAILIDRAGGTRSAFAYRDEGYGTYLGHRQAVVVVGSQVLTGASAHAAKMALHLALSNATSFFRAETARRGLGALWRRFDPTTSTRGLGSLERTRPERGRPEQEMRIESRVAGHGPALVFSAAQKSIEEVFRRMGAQVLERVDTAEGHARMRIQIGEWRSLQGPIEVAFDRARLELVISTLSTHPLRAVAVIELQAQDDDTVVSQTNRYQVGPVTSLARHALGLEARMSSFWREFHRALGTETQLAALARSDRRPRL